MTRPQPRAAIAAAAAAAALAAVATTIPATPASAADPWAAGTVGTVGKIIWETGDGQLGHCSGAIVDAPNGSVIATAAHCVSSPDSPRSPSEGWFVPAYDHDRDSYQSDGWRITSFHTAEEWDVTRQMTAILPHDYAFLTVAEKDGLTVQEAYGANRMAFEPVEEGLSVAVLGYPAVDPYDGESLHSCAGTANVLAAEEAEEPNVGGLLLEDCDLTAGSSGGPWLTGYDPAGQSGTVVAVMSVGSGEGQVIGRPFPESARDLLEQAGGSEANGDQAKGDQAKGEVSRSKANGSGSGSGLP